MTTESGDLPPTPPHALENIKGIGPTRQRLLADLLEIKTVQDLAEASAQSIEAGLKAAGNTVALRKIAEWIAQAQQLLAEGDLPLPAPDEEAETPAREEISAPAAESADEEDTPEAAAAVSGTLEAAGRPETPSLDGPDREALWQTQASFVVEMQTRQVAGSIASQARVSCRETGETVVLAEVDGAPLQTWMLDRFWGEAPPPSPQTQGIALPPQEELAVTVGVRQVAVVQPPVSGIPVVALDCDRSLPSPLLANRPFDLNVSFDIPELAELPVPSQSRYRLAGFAKTLAYPHRVIPLGEGQWHPLGIPSSRYGAALTNVVLPSGLYRLQLLISFQGIAIPFGIHEIQRFQVV